MIGISPFALNGISPFALSLSKGFLRQAQDDRKYRLSPNGVCRESVRFSQSKRHAVAPLNIRNREAARARVDAAVGDEQT